MTSISSHRSHSSASTNHSSHRHRSNRSRSGSRRRSAGSDYERSDSHSTDDRSRSRSHSRSHSRSNYSRSRSASRSVSKRSRSWSGSGSHSADRRSFFSRSRSHTRSRSSSYKNGGGRRSYPHSSSRSHSRGSSARSRSRTPTSPLSLIGGRDPRDRSKRVKWPNAVWLVGEKAKDVVFHFCDICDLPVVIYGRLLPCKHVLCFTCAAELPNKCNRCHKTIQTIERCLIGGIFMCFESDGCRRTYLSQRDLQAHIDHRHKGGTVTQATVVTTAVSDPSTTGSAIPSVISSKLQLNEPIRTSLSSATSLKATSKELLSPPRPIHQQPSLKTTNINTSSNTTSHAGTSCFPGTGKSMGLLPLPKPATPQQPSTMLHNRLPIGVGHPSLRLPGIGAFPQMSQFSTPPPPLGGHRNLPPPPSVMNPSIPPPSVPPPQSGPQSQQQQQPAQTFGNASALAALAAAFSAQSKASSLTSRPDNLLTSSGPLQTAGLNLSLISNVLRNANAAWAAQPNALSNLSNIAQQANLQPSNQLLNNRPGTMNMRRFPS